MEAGSPVHLALDGFESIDLTFNLAIAPRSFYGRNDGAEILLQTGGETYQRADTGLGRCPNPMQHAIGIFVGDSLAKIHSQHAHGSDAGTICRDLLEQGPLLFR